MNIQYKKPKVFFDFGKVCDTETLLNEINNIYSNKYIYKGDRISNTWSGIPLININGDTTVIGLRRKINELPRNDYKYTDFLKESKNLQDLIKKTEKHLNSKCFFARLLKLEKKGHIKEHKDGEMFNKTKYRFHIMLTKSSPKIWMNINGDRYYMKSGYLYNTDVSYIHSVTNQTNYDRINLHMDFHPSEKIKNFIED